jgi:hypothetical protein
MRRRFRLRWWRAFAWRLVRRQYMVVFTLIALGVAGAGALGYFDASNDTPAPKVEAVAPTSTLVPYATPLSFSPAVPLTVTYYLVDNEREKRAYEHYEDDMIFRELLEKEAIEVLLIQSPEDQARADQILAEAKVRSETSGFILVVLDLRK